MTGAGAEGRWNDLAPRLLTAAALGAVAAVAILLGGVVFGAFVVALCGAVLWEASRMAGVAQPFLIALPGAIALAGLLFLPTVMALTLILVVVILSRNLAQRVRMAHAVICAAVPLAGYGIVTLRIDHDPFWLVWLVAIVVSSDVAGYFAGRYIGGPKFWPRISPKKTWSGTVAGWIAAASIGAVGVAVSVAGPGLVALSVAVAVAAQLGDIAESALKREVGVKDSSSLLPGHGGFFDRLDGMLGASLFLLFVQIATGFPPPQV